jgi:hypothetical protein
VASRCGARILRRHDRRREVSDRLCGAVEGHAEADAVAGLIRILGAVDQDVGPLADLVDDAVDRGAVARDEGTERGLDCGGELVGVEDAAELATDDGGAARVRSR